MLNKKIGLIALLTSVAASGVWAGTLTNYAVGDVLICFRKGTVDMVVDAGPVSTFTSASHNQRIAITQYTGGQLADVGTNGVSWSAFTWLSDNTLFMTRPRSSVDQQTTPWKAATSPVQFGVVARMETIPPGALDALNLLSGVYPQTSTAVVEEDDSDGNANYTDGASYHSALAGAYGSDWNGTFQGNPEYTTSSSFVNSGKVVRSDFYQMSPTGAASVSGTWLGYFELNTNGVMTYVAYPTTTPSISSITRSGTTATITYVTGLYGTYNLIGTNDVSAPVSMWPVVGGNLSSGDTASHTVQDTDSATNKFYIIEGQ
jgi:hypothetical protein